jgi:hypothetical protein
VALLDGMTIDKSKSTDETKLLARVRSLIDVYRERDDLWEELWKVYWNEFDIDFPLDAQNPLTIHSGAGSQQVDLLYGLFDDYFRIKVSAVSKKQEDVDAAQRAERFIEMFYPLVEEQTGDRVFSRALKDTILFGMGVVNQDLALNRYSTEAGMPDLLDKEGKYVKESGGYDYERYNEDRTDKIRSMAHVDGRMPLVYRHVPSRRFYYRFDPESPNGIAEAVEVRYVSAIDLIENPRYSEKLEQFEAELKKRFPKGDYHDVQVKFIVHETTKECTYMLINTDYPDPEDESYERKHEEWLAQDQALGEGLILENYPNKLGRVRYVIIPGLLGDPEKLSLRYISMIHFMVDLIKAKDSFYSFRLTREAYFVFNPIVMERDPALSNSLPGDGTDNKGQIPPFKLAPGPFMVTPLPLGAKLTFLINPGGGKEEINILEEINRNIDISGLPRALLDPQGDPSGYASDVRSNNAMARYRPIINGVRTFGRQAAKMLLDLMVVGKLDLEVEYPLSGQKGKNAADWVKLSWQDLRDLKYVVEASFDLKKPSNLERDLANFINAKNEGAYSRARSRAIFLKEEDSERIEEEIEIERVMDSPPFVEFRIQKALEEANLTMAKLMAEEQGEFDLEDLMNATPSLRDVIQQAVGMGQPGFQTTQNMGAAPNPADQNAPLPAPGGPGPAPGGIPGGSFESPGAAGGGGNPAPATQGGMPIGPRGTGGFPTAGGR